MSCMYARAVTLALKQMGDASFRTVFLIGTGVAFLVFVALVMAVGAVLPEDVLLSQYDWLNDALNWMLAWSLFPLFILITYVFFPAVSTAIMGPFLDRVVDAVEDVHYPDARATHKPSLFDTASLTLRLGLSILIANLLALPFYLVLVFTAIGPFILFLILNSALLGREYFELVAMRHMDVSDIAAFRRSHRDKSFLLGGLITVLFIIPVVNLFAPILATAIGTHVFHAIKNDDVHSGDDL